MMTEQGDPISVSAHRREPVLSLVLCSRNDQFMGNSRWRLETTLNYVARNLEELGREKDVEIIVADWGSERPLRDVVKLGAAAAKMVLFMVIPRDIARDLQKDSPFSEVHALNAAARRVNGQYIGRIDADTLVGKRFLCSFFEFCEGSHSLGSPLDSTIIWANRRGIPYRFAARCGSFWQVDRFIRCFGHMLPIDTPGDPFFDAPVGIWFLPRKCWEECGGYDERLIYWGNMEIDMICRLRTRYKLVHLEEHIDCDFYHLEHYHPLMPRVTPRRTNPELYDNVFDPNGGDWGLARYGLEILPYSSDGAISEKPTRKYTALEWPAFLLSLLVVGTQIIWEKALLGVGPALNFVLSFSPVWRRRARVAWKTVCGQPLPRWPGLLTTLCLEKLSRRRPLRRKRL